MLKDAKLVFSDAQAVTAAAASDSVLDTGINDRDIGVGEELWVVVHVTVAFTDAGSNSTLTVDLEGDSSTSFTPDGLQTLFIIPALAAIGAIYMARINPDFAAKYRYLRLKYTPNNGDLSTGTVTAFITNRVQKSKIYPNGYTIS